MLWCCLGFVREQLATFKVHLELLTTFEALETRLSWAYFEQTLKFMWILVFWLQIFHGCLSIVIYHLKIIFAILALVSWLSSLSIDEILNLVLKD